MARETGGVKHHPITCLLVSTVYFISVPSPHLSR